MKTINVNGYFAGTIAGAVRATLVSPTVAQLPNGERFTVHPNGTATADWKHNEARSCFEFNGLVLWENGTRKVTTRAGAEAAEVLE